MSCARMLGVWLRRDPCLFSDLRSTGGGLDGERDVALCPLDKTPASPEIQRSKHTPWLQSCTKAGRQEQQSRHVPVAQVLVLRLHSQLPGVQIDYGTWRADAAPMQPPPPPPDPPHSCSSHPAHHRRHQPPYHLPPRNLCPRCASRFVALFTHLHTYVCMYTYTHTHTHTHTHYNIIYTYNKIYKYHQSGELDGQKWVGQRQDGPATLCR